MFLSHFNKISSRKFHKTQADIRASWESVDVSLFYLHFRGMPNAHPWMVRVRCFALFVCIIQSVFKKSLYFFFFQTILLVYACRIIVSLFWAETRREKFHIPTADGQASQYPVLNSLMKLCAVLLILRDKNAPNCMIMVLNNWTNYSNDLDIVSI